MSNHGSTREALNTTSTVKEDIVSVSASITLTLDNRGGPHAMVEALLQAGWCSSPDGWWCIPLGEDPGEWRLVDTQDREHLYGLVRSKFEADEVFGVRLFWRGEDIGGEFLMFRDGRIVFSPTINRVTLLMRTTDVSWYLSRLLPALSGGRDVALDSWEWQETA